VTDKKVGFVTFLRGNINIHQNLSGAIINRSASFDIPSAGEEAYELVSPFISSSLF
jgi:hypothetical protein